ncbi:hypothetical protein B296_00018577 [Ensete ventricosum]|uniref:Uncharacterized protein n=1 Tax=Ensete ventricosum TaxID=4639 RepID=A0A427B3L0_ENSVE|nr:hypothetical protein B296_00018577 [Ensete ventricosum]
MWAPANRAVSEAGRKESPYLSESSVLKILRFPRAGGKFTSWPDETIPAEGTRYRLHTPTRTVGHVTVCGVGFGGQGKNIAKCNVERVFGMNNPKDFDTFGLILTRQPGRLDWIWKGDGQTEMVLRPPTPIVKMGLPVMCLTYMS